MRAVGRLNVYAMFPLLLLSRHELAGPLAYLRPYLASTMVAASLVNTPPLLARVFEHRIVPGISSSRFGSGCAQPLLLAR
jgi:hypothetical protein